MFHVLLIILDRNLLVMRWHLHLYNPTAGGVRHGLPDPPAAGPLGHGDGVGGAARPPPLPHPRQSRALRQLQVPAHSIF